MPPFRLALFGCPPEHASGLPGGPGLHSSGPLSQGQHACAWLLSTFRQHRGVGQHSLSQKSPLLGSRMGRHLGRQVLFLTAQDISDSQAREPRALWSSAGRGAWVAPPTLRAGVGKFRSSLSHCPHARRHGQLPPPPRLGFPGYCPARSCTFSAEGWCLGHDWPRGPGLLLPARLSLLSSSLNPLLPPPSLSQVQVKPLGPAIWRPAVLAPWHHGPGRT